VRDIIQEIQRTHKRKKVSMSVEGKVAKILGKGEEVVLNRGRSHGVRQGMLFEIFAPEGEEVWDPDTGETLGTVEDVKAKAEVTEVKDKLAVARIFDAGSPFGRRGRRRLCRGAGKPPAHVRADVRRERPHPGLRNHRWRPGRRRPGPRRPPRRSPWKT
jgi:hypothetical protein